MTTATKITFDESLAQRYMPRYVEKQAVLIRVPEGVESTILLDWNYDGSRELNLEPANYTGSYYWVYTLNSQPAAYAVAQHEFEDTHGTVHGLQNGFCKDKPCDAYIYRGEPAVIDTVMADGTIERQNAPVKDGDWIVRWHHGEVGVRPDDKFRSLCDLESAKPLS